MRKVSLDDDKLPERGPSREALLAQVEALRDVVATQSAYVDSMRASRMWRLRDAVFAVLGRLGIPDPLPVPVTEDRATMAAALGEPYQLFRARHRHTAVERERIATLARNLRVTMSIDVAVDSGRANAAQLAATIASIAAQGYPHWRIAVVRRELEDWHEDLDGLTSDDRIRVVSALDRVADAVLPVAAGDLLDPDALLWLVLALNDGADAAYGDHDVLDAYGVPSEPVFKPDWSPESELTRDYVERPCAFRSAALREAGGVPESLDQPAWYDALLRVSERGGRIDHVPLVLCHRAKAARADRAYLNAVSSALERRGEPATVGPSEYGWDVRFVVPGTEHVTIVVPTRDRAELLERCLTSVFERTAYGPFDLIVVDNGSREARTHALLTRWKERYPHRVRVLSDPAPFNFSRLNNVAVRTTDSPYVVLLNNDVEVIEPTWLEAMLGQARRPPIGAVGAVLLYADGSVQHAGIVLGGVLNLAGHAYRHADGGGPPAALHLDTNYLAVTGACLMVDRAKYEAVGGLDETLEFAYNDVDFCLRLQSRGYRNVVVPRARLYHLESKTRGLDDNAAKVARTRREAAVVRERWPAWVERDPYYNPNLSVTGEDFSLRL